MRTRVLALAILQVTLAVSSPAVRAQSASIARLVFFEARPGTKSQFEEALKQQIDWRRDQKDPWRWLTWEYTSGEVPRYCVGTFGHAWSDFDQVSVAGRAEDVAGGAAGNLASTPPTVQYFEHLKEVSDPGPEGPRPTLAEISLYQLRYGKTAQFYSALREAHKAVSRAGHSTRYEWFELQSGGETPQFLLLVPRENWGALDVDPGLFFQRLETGLGKRKARRVFEQFTSAVKTHQRWVVRLRPDLSLLPTVASAELRVNDIVSAISQTAVPAGSGLRQSPAGPALPKALVRDDGESGEVATGDAEPVHSPAFPHATRSRPQ
jgi:hypothetical protein